MVFTVISIAAQARPVSYPSGWTNIITNDGSSNSLLVHYSPTAKTSIGYRLEHLRENNININSLQINNLIKRWNNKDSQANFYLKLGIGSASINSGIQKGEDKFSAFTGIAADWEDRRYFVSYENKYTKIDDTNNSFYKQSARFGWAPYEGDYGDLHTWIMLQTEHSPKATDKYTVTPLIRIFKDVHLAEFGVSNHGNVLLNYTIRY